MYLLQILSALETIIQRRERKMKEFYEKHKVKIWIGVSIVGIYVIGYKRGYNAYRRALADGCRIMAKEFKVDNF